MKRVMIFAAVLTFGFAARAERNLQTCLDGRYPALCNHSALTAKQALQTRRAELSANLRQCLDGRYPALCKHEWLTPSEAQRALGAERRANLKQCLDGRYPALCRHELLSRSEAARVDSAEGLANLGRCMRGLYPALCDHSRLTPQQSRAVARAEQRNGTSRLTKPKASAQRRTSSAGLTGGARGGGECESGHWIDEVGEEGETLVLEDGTEYDVLGGDQVTASLWLPTTDVVVCPDKIINPDDDESVDVMQR